MTQHFCPRENAEHFPPQFYVPVAQMHRISGQHFHNCHGPVSQSVNLESPVYRHFHWDLKGILFAYPTDSCRYFF